MGSPRRSNLETYYEMLLAMKKGINRPTPIMYRTNLSWGPLSTKLAFLVEAGFVSNMIIDNHKAYSITPEGTQMLSDLQKVLAAFGHPVAIQEELYH